MDEDAGLEAHFDLLKQQKQFLTKAKSRAGQQPTQAMRRSRLHLEQEFLTAALSAQKRVMMNRHQMNTTFIGEAYPPSVQPVCSLDPILLHDLRLEMHHRGRVLIVKTFCEPVRMSAIQNAIEDIQGSVDRLYIYNLPSATPVDKVLPKGVIVAVKEPYFKATADGGVMVRVDHPSDFVMLEPHDPSVPPQWRREVKPVLAAHRLKDEGNTAFKNGNWQRAGELYTEALAKSDNNADLRSTLYRNRAQAYLNLGKYESASEDATASIVSGDKLSQHAKVLNVKSYFRASRAHYQLGDFELAKKYLDQALDLDPTDETIIADLARTKQRILEQQNGNFDFIAMAQSATMSHRKLDHASFTNNTKVGPAGKRGRGLFATKNIKHGSVVMVEKAFCAVFGDKLGKDRSLLVDINTDRCQYGTHPERLYEIIDKMRCNPTQASKFLELWDGGAFNDKKVSHVDGLVVVDTFQAHTIAEFNGFGCPAIRSSLDDKEDPVGGSTGIWLQASYMNHSCVANTLRAFIGDIMIVRATRDIKAGEEIFTSYQLSQAAFPKRKENFKPWGFQCDCPLCQAERRLPSPVFTGRELLEQEAMNFIAANPRTEANLGQPVAGAKLADAKDILRRLETTYGKPLYETFPRHGCVDIDLWLVQASGSAVKAGLSSTLDIAATSRLIQDLGYKVKVKGAEVSIDRTNGFVCPQVVHAALFNQVAWRMAGKPEVAEAFFELAKEAYLAICGVMDGFEETFGGL